MDLEGFVLAASTADLTEEPRARADADAVEFRLDLAAAPLEQLDDYTGELPLLATNRVRSEGGRASEGPERLETLAAALDHDAVEAVDLELAAVETGDADPVLEAAKSADAAVVVSTHDFETTPDRQPMAAILRRAAAAGDVGKLSVTAADPGDALATLAVTWELSSAGVPVATTTMGEPGRHARAVAPIYGSRLGYAPVDPARATAPGQYDLTTLRGLIDGLRSGP